MLNITEDHPQKARIIHDRFGVWPQFFYHMNRYRVSCYDVLIVNGPTMVSAWNQACAYLERSEACDVPEKVEPNGDALQRLGTR